MQTAWGSHGHLLRPNADSHYGFQGRALIPAGVARCRPIAVRSCPVDCQYSTPVLLFREIAGRTARSGATSRTEPNGCTSTRPSSHGRTQWRGSQYGGAPALPNTLRGAFTHPTDEKFRRISSSDTVSPTAIYRVFAHRPAYVKARSPWYYKACAGPSKDITE